MNTKKKRIIRRSEIDILLAESTRCDKDYTYQLDASIKELNISNGIKFRNKR